MGIYCRAWITLGYSMFMRGEQICELKFKNLVFGVDDENDSCLLFSFNSRKSMNAYKENMVLFYICPNPEEKYIDSYKYVKD